MLEFTSKWHCLKSCMLPACSPKLNIMIAHFHLKYSRNSFSLECLFAPEKQFESLTFYTSYCLKSCMLPACSLELNIMIANFHLKYCRNSFSLECLFAPEKMMWKFDILHIILIETMCVVNMYSRIEYHQCLFPLNILRKIFFTLECLFAIGIWCEGFFSKKI